MNKSLRDKNSPPGAKYGSRSGAKHAPDDDAINRFNILDLFGKERLETIQDTVAKATGLGLVTLDYKGDPITEMTGFTPFCQEMRKKETSSLLCRSSDVYGAGQALALQQKSIYFCPCGLLEVAIPIIVKNHYLGGFYGGQVRCDNAPKEIIRLDKMLEGQLKSCPFSEKQKKLHQQIPVYDYTYFEYITELISLIINQIGEKEIVTQGHTQHINDEVALLREQVRNLENELSHRRRESVNMTARSNYYFLINTLNAVSNMAELEQAERTNEMVLLFADHLKYGAPTDKNFILLSEEVADVQRYLMMQKIRFDTRLQYEIFVPKELGTRKIPVHVIMPFIEFSVFYGMRTRDAALRVDLAVALEENTLVITVTDDGPGLTEEELTARFAPFKNGYEGEGIRRNMAAVRRRLADLYGEDGEVTLRAVPGKGTECVIKFPAQLPTGEF